MGLLDNLTNDPAMALGMGLLSAGGNSRTPVSFGQGLASGWQNMQEAQKEKQRAALLAQQAEMQKMQMEQMRQQQAEQAAMQQAAREAFQSPAQQALIGGQGPTNEAAAMLPGLKPKFDQQAFIANLAKVNPLAAMQMMQKKTPIKLGADETLLDPDTMNPIAKGTPKSDSVPSAIKEYQFAVGQGFKGTFQDFVTQQKRAGATSIAVNTDNLGLKPKDRFEMEDKLRNDYTKSVDLDTKILTTSDKMKAVLSGDPNALKDQAAIYSFAKLLDPDGAVREADYAAITNTAGLTDRLKNYTNKILTGQMLSPKQRDEMAGVLSEWEQVAKRRIASQQKSYSSRSKMYNLSPENVFQPQAASIGGDEPPAGAVRRKK